MPTFALLREVVINRGETSNYGGRAPARRDSHDTNCAEWEQRTVPVEQSRDKQRPSIGIILPVDVIRTSIDEEDNYTVLKRSSCVLLASIAVALLWGCTSNPATATPEADFFVNAGAAFPIAFGETAAVQTVAGAVFLVRFADVVSDSRCAAGAACEEPGFAAIELSVQTALALNDVVTEVPPEADVSIVVEEITIEFLEVVPEAQDGVLVPLLDYRLGLRVTQTGDLGIPVQ